jgi:hypothetical protein
VAETRAGLRITPRIIEIGDEIIAVASVSRVSIGADPVKARRAGYLVAAALVLGGLALAALGSGQLGAGFIVGFVAVVAMLIAVGLMRGEALFIATNDGRTTILLQKRGDFMRSVLELVRAAMEAEPGGQFVYQVNIQAERIERLDASRTDIAVSSSPGATVAGRDLNGSAAHRPTEEPKSVEVPVYASPAAHNGPDTFDEAETPTGAQAEPLGINPRDWFRKPPERSTATAEPTPEAMVPPPTYARPDDARPSISVNGAPGAITIGRDANNARIETHVRSETLVAFDDMMTRIAPQYGDRFGDVRQWLAPVRDYLEDGRGNLAEAQSRWSIFAKEHLPALANVATVADLAAKVGRGLGLAI